MTLIISVHAFARSNHKSIVNEVFHRYLKEVQKTNSEHKGSLNQRFQGLFFALYAWNAGLVDGNEIYGSVLAIHRELTVLIYF